jgi:hypothetical protein
MKKLFSVGLACAGLCGMAAPAQAAPDVATETRPVDARVVRVQLDGAVALTIRRGTPPQITLNGEPRALARTSTVQSGELLIIDGGSRGLRMGSLHAELVLPALREVSSESLGSTDVTGFSGDELVLSLDGAGSMKVAAAYRTVKASLGGIGSMKLDDMDCERIDLNMQGAGVVVLTGRARALKAELGGLGNLDAHGFSADSVDIDLSGLGNASVTARQNANLNLSGLGSVTVYGKPATRRVAVEGLGKVTWK